MEQYDVVWHSLSSACENSSIISLNYLFLHVGDSSPPHQTLAGFNFYIVLSLHMNI